ncbi:ABC transporter permease [Bacillus horti]|uniref:ABC-2 type transport system permease protein n=1 Tax=Caldalkalibacillus horti TaxID=77523 RepID=A0ABT9W4Q4_9BACI|nr:ABC transporter permease [Bacillus horti]MDQ0168221.1 ABC-2 type transport system permease protein [Bacillus horti]
MKHIGWLIRKTWKTTFRNYRNLPLYFAFPLLGILLSTLIHGASGETTLNVGILNHDVNQRITEDTIKFIEELKHVQIHTVDETELNAAIVSGELDLALILANGFAESVQNGRPHPLQIVSIKGAEATGYVKAYLNQYMDNLATIGQVTEGNQEEFKQLYTNYLASDFKLSTETLEDISATQNMSTQTVGYLITIMLFSAGTLSGMILKEKENRTYFRLLASPVTSRAYVLSNMIVNLAVMTLQIALTLVVMERLFQIDTGVPFWQVFLILILFALIAISISLTIVAFAKSSSLATAIQNLIIMPTSFLAGCFIPIEVMPLAFQKMADFLPQRWLLDTFDKLQQGSSFESMYLNIIILFAFVVTFSLIAVYLFERNKDTRTFI